MRSTLTNISPRQARQFRTAAVVASVLIVVGVVAWCWLVPVEVAVPELQSQSQSSVKTVAVASAEADLEALRPLWSLPLRRSLQSSGDEPEVASPTPVAPPASVRLVGLVGSTALIEQDGRTRSLRIGETLDGVGTLQTIERGRVTLEFRGRRVTLDLPYDSAPDRLLTTR